MDGQIVDTATGRQIGTMGAGGVAQLGALPMGDLAIASVRSRDVRGGVLTDAAQRFGTERPGDVRYMAPGDFADAMRGVRARATEARADLSTLRAEEINGDVAIIGRSGAVATPTHWAMTQLCQRVKFPADKLRELPADLAAAVLTDRLRARGAEGGEAGLLFSRHGDDLTLRAATGPDYGRIWDADLAADVAEVAEGAGFSAPIAFKSAARTAGTSAGATPTGTEHALACAVASDRDSFLYMVDYSRTIRVPGYTDPVFRGFMLSNSEVGLASAVFLAFLYDGTCYNFNAWGVIEATEIRLRHTKGVHKRTPTLYQAARDLSSLSAADDEARIVSAQRTLVADTTEKAVDRLFGMRLPGVTRAVAEAAVEVAKETPRYGDPRSVWAVGNGLTEVSQRETYAGDRAQIDRSAGKVFRIAF